MPSFLNIHHHYIFHIRYSVCVTFKSGAILIFHLSAQIATTLEKLFLKSKKWLPCVLKQRKSINQWSSAFCLHFTELKWHEILFLTSQCGTRRCFISRSPRSATFFFVLNVSTSETFPCAENQTKWPQICILSENRTVVLFILRLVHFLF